MSPGMWGAREMSHQVPHPSHKDVGFEMLHEAPCGIPLGDFTILTCHGVTLTEDPFQTRRRRPWFIPDTGLVADRTVSQVVRRVLAKTFARNAGKGWDGIHSVGFKD